MKVKYDKKGKEIEVELASTEGACTFKYSFGLNLKKAEELSVKLQKAIKKAKEEEWLPAQNATNNLPTKKPATN